MDEFPEGFDLEALLAPISEAAPVGSDPREDMSAGSPYFRLRDARAEARANERAKDGGTDAGEAQWRPVCQLATQVLLKVGKDLEVAAWLSEALLREEGLVGLTAGLRTMTGIAEQYWDEFFPREDEEGLEGRLAALAGLNGTSGDGTLMQPLRKIVLFDRTDGTPFPFWQYKQSEDLAGIGDATRRQQRLDAGVVPFEKVEEEARAANSAGFAALRRQAAAAVDAWQALSDVLDAKAGRDAPPTSNVRDLLNDIVRVAKFFAPDGEGGAASGNGAAAPADGAASAGGAVAMLSAGGGPVAAGVRLLLPDGFETREDALRVLLRLAEFFRRTEPQSPLAYTLQEAVRRARMSLPDLLAEIVPDVTSRASILTSLGIKPPNEPE
jgi:type VI secretion system protein ImpA